MVHGRSWKTKRIGAGFLQTPIFCGSEMLNIAQEELLDHSHISWPFTGVW